VAGTKWGTRKYLDMDLIAQEEFEAQETA